MKPRIALSEFDALVDRYFSVLTLFARRWAPGAAEDVAQETFLKLLKFAQKRGVPENVSAWLFQTAKTTAIDESRKLFKRRKLNQTFGESRDLWFDAPPEERVFALEIAARLETLPDAEREIVVLRVWGSLSFDEIARIVGASKATVFRGYRKALETLRDADPTAPPRDGDREI